MVQPAQRLLDLWRERLFPAASRERVAIAFALVAGGAVLAVLGVILVALGDAVLPRPSWLREAGFVAAAAGLPVFLLGFVAGLPTRKWMIALSALGATGAAIGVGLFALWYPDQWYLTVRAPNSYAIGAYMGGVSLLAATAAAELAHYFVEGAGGAAEEQTREITDEEILADLEWAENQGWNWGGIRDRVDATVRLKEETGSLAFSGRGKRYIRETDVAEEPAKAAKLLTALRGKKKENTDAAVGDQVAYLKQLKAQQAAEQQAKQESWSWKLLHPIQWLRS